MLGAVVLPWFSPLTSAPAAAEDVTPAVGQSVVSVHVGSDRTGGGISGLGGATVGAFIRTPAADGSGPEPIATCVSQENGWCHISVPIGQGAGQVPARKRVWVASIQAPDGYYSNPSLQTATGTSGSPQTLRHVWPTPALVAGQQYKSGEDFAFNGTTSTSDLDTAANPDVTVSQYSRRVQSGGTIPMSRTNPEIPAECGLNIGLVVDLSGSMSGSVRSQLLPAMDDFIDALRGTPSQAALYTFNNGSPASGGSTSGFGANRSLQSVATTADAEAFKSSYAAWPEVPSGEGLWTNWDAGLSSLAADNVSDPVSSQHIDIAIMLTDGNPTVWGDRTDANSEFVRFREIETGLASANVIKAQATKVLAVGVGAGTSGDGALNLRALSGPTAYNGANIAEADYIQSDNFGQAAAALRSFVLDHCAPSISVSKRIVPFNGTVADAEMPGTPWTFSAESEEAEITPATGATGVATGSMAFDLAFDQGPVGATITEENQDGFTPMPEETYCVNKTTGDDVPVPVTPGPDPETSFSVDGIDHESVITCTVYNRAPDTDSASVQVHKRWRVQTSEGVQEYLAGEGAPFSSQLSLSDPGAPGSVTDWGWSDPRSGYSIAVDGSVVISETVGVEQLNCELTDAEIAPGAPADDNEGESIINDNLTSEQQLSPGENEWTLTNTVECHSYLTLAKDLRIPTELQDQIDPDTARQWWDLDATGPEGSLDGPSGQHGSAGATRIEVSPGQTYQLTEALNTDEHDALHFALTGWACVRDPGSGGDDGFPVEKGSEVAVPLGEAWVCRATNVTSMMTMQKTVVDGDADPADFVFEVSPQGDDPRYHPHQVRGGPPDNVQPLVPSHPYAVTEIGGPPGYELVGPIRCETTGGVPVGVDDFVLLPGEKAVCSATNRFTSDLTVRKLDAADDAPLAGGHFELWRDENGDGPGGAFETPVPGDTKVGECATGDQGQCRVDDLALGDYYWFEAAAPPGYLLPDDRFSDVVSITTENAGPDGERPVAVFRDQRATWTTTKSSNPPSGSQVAPGDVITYTLTARPLDGVTVHDVRIRDDLSDVLEHAVLLDGSIQAEAGVAEIRGSTLHWDLATLSRPVTLSYQVRVNPDAWSQELVNVVTGPEDPAYVPCDRPSCDSTEHHVPAGNQPTPPDGPEADDPEGGGAALPDTGGPSFWALLTGMLLLAGGGATLVAARRR